VLCLSPLQTMASGRFETLGEILTHDNLLFPFLRRCKEGRALRAVGPATEEVPTSDGGSRAVITLSGAVAQEVDPPRWPREVCRVFSLFICAVFDQIFSLFICPLLQLQGEWQRIVGSLGDQPGQFNQPCGLALTPDEAFLLVVDTGNHRVAVVQAMDGTWVRQLMGPPGTLPNPWDVAVVPSTGEVLVSDWIHNQVVRFQSIDDDTMIGTLGTGRGSGPMQFIFPSGLAVLDGSHLPFVGFFHFPLS
jgi:hypothetical protein